MSLAPKSLRDLADLLSAHAEEEHQAIDAIRLSEVPENRMGLLARARTDAAKKVKLAMQLREPPEPEGADPETVRRTFAEIQRMATDPVPTITTEASTPSMTSGGEWDTDTKYLGKDGED